MIVFISGAKDAGKTTTANGLKACDKSIAVVEPDIFFSFLPTHLSILEKAPYCVELSAYCAQQLHKAGFLVVIPYPVTNTDHARYRSLLADISPNEILCLTLVPTIDDLFKRAGLLNNESDDARWRRSVIEEQYYGTVWGEGVVFPAYPAQSIDSSHLRPQEVVDRAYEMILSHQNIHSDNTETDR